MARAHDSMIYPPIEDLLERVDSKFSLVTLAARRARQINSYYLGDKVVPPQVPSVARKPLSTAFEEVAAVKIVPVPIAEEPETDAEAAEDALPEGPLEA